MGEAKLTQTFVLGVFMCVFGGSFQYGWNVSNVNGPAPFIKARLFPSPCVENCLPDGANSTIVWQSGNCTCTEEEYKEQAMAQTAGFSTAVGMFPIGGMVGSFATSFMVTKFGRKGAQMCNMFISILGGALYILSYYLANSICMYLARFFVGVFAGLATGVCPMYAIEIANQNLRGVVGVLCQLFITIGILSAQIIAFPQIMGKPELWGWLMSLTAVPAILWLILSPLLVETPRYTLIEKHMEDQARKDLVKLRGTDAIDEEIKELEQEALKQQEDNVEVMSVMELFKDQSLRWQLIVCIVGQIGQQLSGINAIFFYTNDIFKAAGFSPETSTIISSLVGVQNVLMTFVSVALIERMGRTGLSVYGYGIMTFFCCGMFLSLKYLTYASFVPYLSIVCILGYIVGFAIGPGPVPWIWNSEYFKQSARGPAGSVACALNWTAAFLVGKFFPIAQGIVGEWVFIFFAAVSIFCLFFLGKFAVETKGKTFRQIEAEFALMNGVEQNDDEEKVKLNQDD